MKAVVLAEKPSVARDIARVLKCNKKGEGFLEGDKYIVTWALGHLVTLADPEYYDKKYQQWKLEDLPMLPPRMKTVVMKQTTKQFYAVKKQLLRKDVNEIIIATDAGREGELVARLIMVEANVRKPYKRLWISSSTDKAIKEGFSKLQDGKKYDNLYASAFARASADWYVGMNATRALTTKYNAQLSSGRVQTPTLAMIAGREEEIRSFVPKHFYGMQALAQNLVFTWKDAKTGSTQTFTEDRVSSLQKALQGQPLIITGIEKKQKKQSADMLYDLTELQRDANTKFGMSPKQTLNAMQGLYERHKMLTYPRTDSRYLTSDIVGTLQERVQAIAVGPYGPIARKLLQGKVVIQGNTVNNAKVSDHHAIIPTETRANLAALSDQERKIYDLVVKKFLATFMPPYIYEETQVTATIGTEIFTLKGKRELHKGWKAVYDQDEKDQLLPALAKGQKIPVENLSKTSGTTTPPGRFTEATLLSAMEKPGKFVKGLSKEVVEQLNNAGGIGTVATRADIIEKLFGSFVIELKGQQIYMTPKGKQLLDLAPAKLRSPILTAQWEGQLDAIARGEQKSDVFLANIQKYARELVQEIKDSKATFKHQNVSTKVCPTCGKQMLEVNGKRGKMLVCADRACGTRQNVSTVTNARCPECKKKLELFGDGEGRIFVCRCGYREKLSSFEKRRKTEQGTKAASKGEVQNFMKKQKQEQAAAPNAFASAFSKLKLDDE